MVMLVFIPSSISHWIWRQKFIAIPEEYVFHERRRCHFLRIKTFTDVCSVNRELLHTISDTSSGGHQQALTTHQMYFLRDMKQGHEAKLSSDLYNLPTPCAQVKRDALGLFSEWYWVSFPSKILLVNWRKDISSISPLWEKFFCRSHVLSEAGTREYNVIRSLLSMYW